MHDDAPAFVQLGQNQTCVKTFGRAAGGYVLGICHCRRDLPCGATMSTAQGPERQILEHPPQSSDKNRNHANHLGVYALTVQAFVQLFALAAFIHDQTGGRNRDKSDDGQRKGKKEERLGKLDLKPKAQYEQRRDKGAGQRQQPQPGNAPDIKHAVTIDAHQIGKVDFGLPAVPFGPLDQIIGHAQDPVAGG